MQNWKRITTPYNISNPNGGYDYIFNSNNIKEQVIDITSTSTGNIESIGIVTGGFNYRNNDKIVFNKQNNGREARGNVTSIEGKKIVSVDASSTTFVAAAARPTTTFTLAKTSFGTNTARKITATTFDIDALPSLP